MSGPPSSHQHLQGFTPVIRPQNQPAPEYGQPQTYQPGGMAPMHPLANQLGLQPGGAAPIYVQSGHLLGGTSTMYHSGQQPGVTAQMYPPANQFGVQPGGVAPMYQSGLPPYQQPSGMAQFGMQPRGTPPMYHQANESMYLQPGGTPPMYHQANESMYLLANQSRQVAPMYPQASHSGQQPGGAVPIYQQPSGLAHPANLWNQGSVSHQHVSLTPIDHRSQPSPPLLPTQGLHQQAAIIAPKQCVFPEAAAPVAVTTTLRIKMDEILRESNTTFMLRKAGALQLVESRYGYLYYEFPSLEAAESAEAKFNNPKDGFLFNIKVGVDRTCDSPIRNKAAAVVKSESSASSSSSHDRKRRSEFAAQKVFQGSEKKYKVMLGPLLVGMHPGAFDWKPVKQFSAMKGNSFVELFIFDLATIFGSVSSEVSMPWGTPIGKFVFVGVLSYMCNAFRAGLSWGGCLTPENFMVSSNLMCAIVPFPTLTASDQNMKLDVGSVVSSFVGLFTLNGKMPPYFDDLVLLATNTPANISSDTQAREEYLLKLVNHMSCWPDERIISFLQAFHIFFKNLDESDKNDMNTDGAKTVAASRWKKPIKTDQLLSKVLDGSLAALVESIGNGAQYLRHFGVHSNDHIYNAVKEFREALLASKPFVNNYKRSVDKQGLIAAHPQPVFTVKERVMVIACYFKKFLARFSSFLFTSVEKKLWIKELCTPFIKSPYETGAAPLGSLILDGASDAPWHTLFKVLNGAGPTEILFYLKMAIRALWSINKFRDELSNRIVLHKSSHLRDDDISCAMCALSGICTSLSNSSKEQPNAAHLLNLLVKAYSQNKDIIKGGRNYSAELLEMIYKCLHLSSSVQPDSASSCKSDACLVHRLFGLDSGETLVCGKCGNACEKGTSNKFIHCITANSLIIQKSKYPSDSLGALLKHDMPDR